MATGEGVTRIPKGARRAQEAAGIDPSTGDFVDGTQDMGDPPAVDPVPIAQQQPPSDAAVPAAAPPPAPVSAPAVPDPIADLGLTFDDEPAPTAVTNDAALAALELSKAALDAEQHSRKQAEEEIARLRAELEKRQAPAEVKLQGTDAVGDDAMTDIYELLIKPATEQIMQRVEALIDARLGAVSQRQAVESRKTTRQRTLDEVYRLGKSKLGMDVEPIMASNQFRVFLDTRAPGTRDSVGAIITAAIDAGDAETALYHLERFVASRVKPLADRTIETGAPAATSPSVVRGGASAPVRKSRAALQAMFNEARRARDTETMNRLTIEIDAHELAGLLDA